MDELSQLKSQKVKTKINFIKKLINKVNNDMIFKKIKRNKKIFKPSKDKNEIETKEIIENNKNEINNNQKIIKKRNAGVDLLRILAMLGIVYTHILFHGRGILTYRIYNPKIYITFTYVFWHNNVYALISGIIGYKSTKYSNLLYLWLCVVFYSVGFRYYYQTIKKVTIQDELYKDFYPVLYERYWYFTNYFVMFLFLPAVNKGIQYLSKPEFKLLVWSIFGILVIWHTYMNTNKEDHFKMDRGFSALWLLCMYIFGAYIGKYNVVYSGIKRYIFSFMYFFIFIALCSIFNTYSETVPGFIRDNKSKIIYIIKRLLPDDINNLFKATQSISITLFFLQLKYNEYLTKLSTFFGPLTFGVYLIHLNPYVATNYLGKILNGRSNKLTENEVILMFIIKTIKIFAGCIIIEYLRYLLFNILKIRKICIFFEKIAYKIAN
jgi:hypothetical protein